MWHKHYGKPTEYQQYLLDYGKQIAESIGLVKVRFDLAKDYNIDCLAFYLPITDKVYINILALEEFPTKNWEMIVRHEIAHAVVTFKKLKVIDAHGDEWKEEAKKLNVCLSGRA